MNTQYPEGRDWRTNGTLFVHSTFRTIQGEGPYAGHTAVFVRLAGCNLQCPFCDTDYTSKRHTATPNELVDIIRAFYRRTTESPYANPSSDLVVVTGGEPFRQNITPFVRALLDSDFRVQVETNGVLYPGDDFPWADVCVVVSPKTPKIHPLTANQVTAYKYVLSHDSVAADGLPTLALGYDTRKGAQVARPPLDWTGPIYVQPMDANDPIENDQNVQAVVKSVIEHPEYIMGVQMHKIARLP